MQSGIDSSRARIQAFDKAAAAPEAPATASAKDFFGADGLTFGDVLDAINPLNHIPIVSELFASATQHTASIGSRLVGGTLMGGPIGFVASLASIIFEDGAGKTPAAAAFAALSGETPAPTQLAEAAPSEPVEVAQLASLSPANASRSDVDSDNALLSLYGTGASSAHDSYRKAQLLPYLRDVNESRVL